MAVTGYEYRQSADAGVNWNPDWMPVPGSNAATTEYLATGTPAGIGGPDIH